MKTPFSVLGQAVMAWVLVFSILAVPQFSRSYTINLIWMTLVVPNLLRFSIGQFPRLAVDRGFFFTATLMSFFMIYIYNQFSPDTREAMRDPNAPSSKKRKLISLLLVTFILGNLIAHQFFDGSIYSDMGWERGNSNF